MNDYVLQVTDFVASGSFATLRENVKYYKTENYALLVKTQDFANNFSNDLTYTDKHGYEFLKNSNIFGGELILSNVGSIGKVFIVPQLNRPATLAPNAIMVRCHEPNQTDWLYFLFRSSFGLDALLSISSATAIKKFNKTDFKKILIPIPPISEQGKIVKELESYEPLLTEYDVLEKAKSKLDTEIYDKLKKSILQYAIQGKLAEQDENDEPASVLLERIRTEKKAQLGKKYVESYIYKGDDNCYYEKVGKNEPVLVEDLPFDIPDSWSWARLKDVVEINPRNSVDDGTMVSFIEMKSLKDGFNNSFVYEKRAWKEVKSGFTHFQNGDVGFAKITPCFQNRKSAIFYELENGYGAGTTELHILRPHKNTMLADYLLWFVKSPYLIEYGKQKFSGTAGQQRFGTDEVKNTLIPIPPQAEQERICLKIKEMLNRIEKDEI